MANETQLGQVRAFIPTIWEAALMYVRYNFVMPRLVRTFTDTRGFAPRAVTAYAEGTVTGNLGELDDLTPQLLTRDLLAQLTPQEAGAQYIITDRRVDTDTENVLADSIEKIGYEVGKKVETDLLAQLGNLRGGSVGTANSSLTWTNIYEARARLAAQGIPAPYSVVMHEYQWADLAMAANITTVHSSSQGAATPLQIRNDIQSRYYVGSIGDMNFYATGLITPDGNDDAVGGMFNSNAIAFDMRRGLRIEPQRDASLRATELNATMVYAAGLWRNNWGVKLLSDASALGIAVTVTSDVVIFGVATPASGSNPLSTTLDYVIVNNGTVVSTGIEVTVTVPANTTYVSHEATQGVYNSTTKKWAAGSLAPGASARLRVNYTQTATGNHAASVSAVTPSNGSARATGNIGVTVS